jgi:hypothetical protein
MFGSIILISDEEDDIISMPGPSKPRISAPRPPSRASVFVDSSDEEDNPKIESMSQLIGGIMSDQGPDRNGKRKAPSAVPRRVSPPQPLHPEVKADLKVYTS